MLIMMTRFVPTVIFVTALALAATGKAPISGEPILTAGSPAACDIELYAALSL